MSVVIGVFRETASEERRVAVVPEVVKKFQLLGAEFCIESGAGAGSYFQDEEFSPARIVKNSSEVFAQSQIIFKVLPPTLTEIRSMRPGSILIGFLNPYQGADRALLLCEKKSPALPSS